MFAFALLSNDMKAIEKYIVLHLSLFQTSSPHSNTHLRRSYGSTARSGTGTARQSTPTFADFAILWYLPRNVLKTCLGKVQTWNIQTKTRWRRGVQNVSISTIVIGFAFLVMSGQNWWLNGTMSLLCRINHVEHMWILGPQPQTDIHSKPFEQRTWRIVMCV